MANVNNPTGFSPVRYVSGAPYNGAVNMYTVAAAYGTGIYIGDPVVDIGTSQTINGVVMKDVQLAATTDVITGIVVGVVPDTRDSLIYRAASTLRTLLVADDPNLLFEVQEGTGGTPLTANDLGLNVSFAAGTPSTVTGISGATVDNATEATTNTLALKLVGVSSRPNNAIGDSCRWLVRLNRHRYVDQLAGV
jgi:RNase P/RNase MRP subunit p29